MGGKKGNESMLLPDEVRENNDVFRAFSVYTLWSVLFIFLIFIYIWQNIIVADIEYNLKKMENQVILLQKEHDKLETEITFLSTPERIGKIAEKELNLVLVKPEDIIWIDTETKQEDSHAKVIQRNVTKNLKEASSL